MKRLVMFMAVFTTASMFASEPSKEVKSESSEDAIYCKVTKPDGTKVECFFCNCEDLAKSLENDKESKEMN